MSDQITETNPGNKIIAIRVVPVRIGNDGIDVEQPQGVDSDTSHYSILVRHENGPGAWIADVSIFAPELALEFGVILAAKHEVYLEKNAFVESYEVYQDLGSPVNTIRKR